MTSVFLKILNTGIASSFIILAVIILRALFRRAPKRLICLLWMLVVLRLLIIVPVSSPFSLLPFREAVSVSEETGAASAALDGNIKDDLRPADDIKTGGDKTESVAVKPSTVVSTPKSDITADPAITLDKTRHAGYMEIASYIWAGGALSLLGYEFVSYLMMKRRLRNAEIVEGNVYQSDRVKTPITFGLIKPRIYIPLGLEDGAAEYAIIHEKNHIARKDHVAKALVFALFAVYWFNPLVWLSYYLLSRDIELSCDEGVVKEMDEQSRRGYADALLSISSGKVRRLSGISPLGFGITGIKERIKRIVFYKKGSRLTVSAVVVAAVLIAAVFLTSPMKAKESEAVDGITTELETENSGSDDGQVSANKTKRPYSVGTDTAGSETEKDPPDTENADTTSTEGSDEAETAVTEKESVSDTEGNGTSNDVKEKAESSGGTKRDAESTDSGADAGKNTDNKSGGNADKAAVTKGGRLVIGDREIEAGKYLVFYNDDHDVEIPIIAVLEELGATVADSGDRLMIRYPDGSEVSYGIDDPYSGDYPPPGDIFIMRRAADNQIITHLDGASTLLHLIAAVNADYDGNTLYVIANEEYYAQLYANHHAMGQKDQSSENSFDYSWPLSGYTEISRAFGYYTDEGGYTAYSPGVLIPAPEGTPVTAISDGRIVISQTHQSYGNYVTIDHGDGMTSEYAYLSSLNCKSGDKVKRGDVIGYVGIKPRTDISMLLFSIRSNGDYRDPMTYFK